jgi:hypothetical protein
VNKSASLRCAAAEMKGTYIMKFCIKCGTQLEEGQNFCVACGAAIDASADSQEAPPVPQPVTPQAPTEADTQSNALVSEAGEAVSQIKDAVKNVNLKEETQKTKGFFIDMFSKPIGTINEVAADSAKHLNVALAVIAVWAAASLISALFSSFFIRLIGWNFAIGDMLQRIIGVITATISPAFIVVVLSAATYIIFKNKIKTFMPLVITITIANAPQAVAAVLRVIVSLIPGSSLIISPVNSLLYLISIILSYFGIKAFADEDDESFFKKFVLIQCIYFGSRIVLNSFGIRI